MNQVKKIPVYDSSERGFPPWDELRDAWRYRYAITQFIRRNIVARYKRSTLGVAWTMLNPLGMMLVRVIVFSTIFGRDPGYPVYVLSGLMVFNFFSDVTNGTIKNLVWGGGGLLKRIYIPRSVFSISSVGSAFVNLSITIIPLFLVMFIVGLPITANVLFLPIAVIPLIAFSMGMGLILSITSVYFPDFAEMYKVVLRAWLYLTPIIYPEAILPDLVLNLIKIFNPLYYLVNIFRIPVYEGVLPSVELIVIAFVYSFVTLFVGWIIFSYRSDEFVYRA